jgi:hypothetical protein
MYMKKLFKIIAPIVTAFALLGAGTLTSCATGPRSTQSSQYHTVGALKIAVDTGMQAWADRVIDGKTTPAQEAKVRAAFNAYKVAAKAYINNALGDTQPAAPDLVSAANALLNLLNAFGINTTGGK